MSKAGLYCMKDPWHTFVNTRFWRKFDFFFAFFSFSCEFVEMQMRAAHALNPTMLQCLCAQPLKNLWSLKHHKSCPLSVFPRMLNANDFQYRGDLTDPPLKHIIRMN